MTPFRFSLGLFLSLSVSPHAFAAPQPAGKAPAAAKPGAGASAAAAKAGQGVSFHKQVMPIFRAACVGCHGEKSAQGGLVLTSYEGLMKGGKGGKEVLPGKAEESRLVNPIPEDVTFTFMTVDGTAHAEDGDYVSALEEIRVPSGPSLS